MKNLRNYQREAVKVSLKSKRGIICLPTGSGKTLVQSEIFASDIKKNKGHRIYMVLAPRIVLSYQLMKEYYSYLNESGIECWYAGLHSGGSVDIKEFEEVRNEDIQFQYIKATTSSIELREEIAKAKEKDLPIIIFGTYHSADRAVLAMSSNPFDIVICDEAHYLVSDQFEDLVKVDGIISNRILFFTATMQMTSSDEGKGMNNEKRFGKVIIQRTPREMIDAGYMVRPRMHIIRFDQDLDRDSLVDNAGKIVAEAFSQHEYIARRTGKLFVTCTGTPMMEAILKSKEIKSLTKRMGVSVYATASNPSIGNQIDGINYSRQEFLAKLKHDGEDNGKEMIILHIDILTEGIDVPGITGILPFRSLKKSKFVQTLGRASRMSVEDLESFADGEYSHTDLDQMMKPYSWVLIPDIEGEDSASDIKDLIRELRTYGFEPSEDIYISNENGKAPFVVLMDPLSQPDHKNPALKEALEDLEHEFEEELIASLIAKATWDDVLERI